ncbi:hypothetical protein SEPCBS57363_004432 [Sporothrix epigloea]|uniref:peptidyl-tRNA hydrolase n=1 Tax=Sporothrix epigloea TaxID=1892477 RepID=A0ABP0DW21_9PEZI
MAGVSHVLILSLGNPGAYINTLHSAGHIALEALRRELMLPPFAKSRMLGGKMALTTTSVGPVTTTEGRTGTGTGTGTQYTMMQSPTLMNVSGPWVARVWRDALHSQKLDRGGSGSNSSSSRLDAGEAPITDGDQLGLILVHDDLEEAMGVLKSRPWARSHRGHNGLKSTNTSLLRNEFPNARWAKLSVGIGRPDARDKSSVADFVLRQMTADERATLEDGLGAGLLATIQRIQAQWAAGQEVGDPPLKPPKPPKQPKSRPQTRPQTRPA